MVNADMDLRQTYDVIQCGVIITLSIFSQILTINTSYGPFY